MEWRGNEVEWKKAAWTGWDEAVGMRWKGQEGGKAEWWTKDVEERSEEEWDQAWWSKAEEDQERWTKAEEGGGAWTQWWKINRNRPPKWIRDQWKSEEVAAAMSTGGEAEEVKDKEDTVMEAASEEYTELTSRAMEIAPWRVTPTVVPARYPRLVGPGHLRCSPRTPRNRLHQNILSHDITEPKTLTQMRNTRAQDNNVRRRKVRVK